MAEESNGGLVFGIRLDNSMLQKDIENAQRMFDSLSKNAGNGKGNIDLGSMFSGTGDAAEKVSSKYSKSLQDLYIAAGNAGAKIRDESAQTAASVSDDLNKLNGGFNAITSLAGKMFLGISAKEIAGKMFETRSYFQDAESSMKVFLGSAEKGTKFINELKDYAYYNMFEFSDLVGASKQLIAYGTEAKNVTDVLDKLSNIATGTGANLNEMIGLYNKAKSVGKIDAMGLESWAAKGVLVKDTLREMGEVVGSTGVTFNQLEKVLAKVTGEGGMFHDLMLEQMDNLSASVGQLEDNLTSMWNELGEGAEDYMKGAIDLAATLVENYQEIGSVLLEVAKIYGAYKLVDMSNIQNIIEQSKAETELANQEARLSQAFKEHGDSIENMLTADQQYELQMSKLEKGTTEYEKAVKGMIETSNEQAQQQLQNLTTLQSAESARLATLEREETVTQRRLNDALVNKDYKKAEILQNTLDAQSEEKLASQRRLAQIEAQKEAAAVKAADAAKKAETLTNMQNSASITERTTRTTFLAKAQAGLGKAMGSLNQMLNSTLLANPYALAIAGAVALYEAIQNIISAQSAMEQAQENIDKGMAKGFEEATKEITKSVDPVFNKFRDLTEGSEAYKEAIQSLIRQYPELAEVLDEQSTKAEILGKGYDAVRKAIIEEKQAAAAANAVTENQAQLAEKQGEVVEKFMEELKEQGFSSLDAQNLATELQLALDEGLNFDELDDKLKSVFENSTEYGKSLLNSLTAGLAFNMSNYDSRAGAIKGTFTSVFGDGKEVEQYNSSLRALFEQQRAYAEAVDETAKNVKALHEEEEANYKDSEKYYSTGAIEQYNSQIKRITDQLSGTTTLNYEFQSWTPEFKAKVRELQQERNKWQRALRDAQKTLLGDDLNAQEAKYKKSIDLYKTFANEYTKIEIKRQNEIDKLQESRAKKDANQTAIDMQIANVNRKTDEELNVLFAKYYNVSDATAAKIKEQFSTSLSLPVEQARERLLVVTKKIEQIKNAAANGETIATKEQQALLTAEQAALQQNINLFDKSEDKRISAIERIAKLEKDQQDKFLSNEVKKQQEIKETYEQLRRELQLMLDNGQITQDKFDELVGSLRNDEFRELSDAWQTTFDSILVQREKLIREYNSSIADVPDEYKDAFEKNMRESLSALDFEKLQKSMDWESVFGNLGLQSTERLKASLQMLETMFEKNKENMGIEQIKTMRESISQLKQELNNRNPFQAIGDGLKTIKENKEELPTLLAEQSTAMEALNVAQSQYDAALAEQLELEKRAKTDKSVKTANQLTKANEKLTSARKNLTKATERLEQANTALTQNESGSREAWEDIAEGLTEVGKVVGNLGTAFKDLGSAIGGSGEEALNTVGTIMSATVSIIDNIVTFTTTSIQGIKTASGVAAMALKTIESASVILAIVGAVIQLGTAIASLAGKKDPVDELRDSLHNFNLELEETKRLAAKEISFKAFDTIFGSDQWGKMKNYIRIGEDALDSYKKIQNDIIAYADTMADTMTQHEGKGISTAIGASTLDPVTGFLHNRLFGNKSVDTVQGAYDNIEDTIANMKVKVKHKTWFRNEKATTLKDLVPSLFNDKGELDKDALHKFVESENDAFGKLSQANQDYLKEMDNAWQEYEESVQEVRDTFSEFFGELGSQISDIWVDAFRTGEYALEDFEKAWDSAIENMVQSMAYNMTLGKIFKDAEDELEKVDFFKAPEENLDKAIGILEEAERKANDEGRTSFNAILQKFKDMGYFKADEEERQAVSGGINNMSQDTAEELNGRMTQIQSHTFAINESVSQMKIFSQQQLVQLIAINANTLAALGKQDRIAAILDDITIRGVKLKS